MTTIVLAALLQTPAANVDTSRAAFTKCLRDETRSSLTAKITPEDFTAGLKDKCDTQRKSFHAALVAADRASGDTLESATESADMQIEDYHANFSDKYKDYSESNSLPGD